MHLPRGAKIGPYEVVTLLGVGGMGEVYGTRDVRLDRLVAVKVIAPDLAARPDSIARFEREARAASALNHPNILHIYDVGTAAVNGSEIRYIAMEYVDGFTLSRKIHREETPLPSLLDWMAQVAEGLAKAHGVGIVHRDLKPDNVMVTTDGYAKILDFGLAKLVERAQPASAVGIPDLHGPQSSSSTVLGTVGYMAPEQAVGKGVDHRADIFSFGCMLYEVITRSRAFDGDSAVDTLHKIIYSPPDPPIESLGVSSRLRDLLARCLEKDPLRRVESMKEVAKELRVLSSGDVSGIMKDVAVSTPVPLRSDSRREPPTVAVLPFDDISPERDNEYFSEGLADEIISDLSKLHSIRVVSRASVMRFKGQQKNIGLIARDLRAHYIVDGSVRKAGIQLRVTSQLIDAATDANIWSETYKGTLNDVFDIQERVARSLAAALKIKVSPEESALLAERPITNIHAYEAYLRSRKLVANFTVSGMNDALAELDRAESMLGENELILAARGYIYWQYYNAGISTDPIYLDRTAQLAEKIFTVDAESHHGHRLLALVLLQRMQIQEAVRHFKKALAIDPNDPDSLVWLVIMYAIVGRCEASEPLIDRALAVDPLSWISLLAPATVRLYQGRFGEAAAAAQKAWKTDRLSATGSYFYAMTLIACGRLNEAYGVFEAAIAAEPDNVFNGLAAALMAALKGEREKARSFLNEEVLAVMRGDAQYCTWVGEIYALLGEREPALEWLDRGVGRGFVAWQYLGEYNPLLNSLHGDSRFEAIIAKARKASEEFEV